jgi:hypothetical protein
MMKNYLPPYLLEFSLVIMFCSCTNDDYTKIEQIERQQLQNKFSLANFDDFIKKLSCC